MVNICFDDDGSYIWINDLRYVMISLWVLFHVEEGMPGGKDSWERST
jgi:hypothetical protein